MLFEQRAVTRTFDTPAFRGMTFFEVQARSIINRVPDASRVPFRWTINPYRGCSHSCVYCLWGETPILMADGRTKWLSELRTGDAVYGTVRRGTYRHYVPTTVLAHWQTVKPAYRVTLEDGTQLIASGDHRFLTGRGWKHVTGAEHGADRRPHLTVGSKLMGVGAFAEPPKHSPEYRRGYLCGMVRGDGHIGDYSYERTDRGGGHIRAFRLALTDTEALARTRDYLAQVGITTAEFTFSEATETRQRDDGHPHRSPRPGADDPISHPLAWFTERRLAEGLPGGHFRRRGQLQQGILRISNTDRAIVGWTIACMAALGFGVAAEDGTGLTALPMSGCVAG